MFLVTLHLLFPPLASLCVVVVVVVVTVVLLVLAILAVVVAATAVGTALFPVAYKSHLPSLFD